jgi:hypothetical protein
MKSKDDKHGHTTEKRLKEPQIGNDFPMLKNSDFRGNHNSEDR